MEFIVIFIWQTNYLIWTPLAPITTYCSLKKVHPRGLGPILGIAPPVQLSFKILNHSIFMTNYFNKLEMVSDEPYKWRNCESLDISEN